MTTLISIFSIIAAIIGPIIRALFPAIIDEVRKPDTAEGAQRRTELRDRLRNRIRQTWGPAVLLIGLLILMLPGCIRTRTVYIPHGEPVRLAETLKDVEVWTVDADGKSVKGRMDIPEGWYAVEDTGDGNE